MYKNIKILLATKHKKEQVIQKPFQETFNAKIVIPENYDTDELGTFTGEIPRLSTPYETVIKKAKDAAIKYHFNYALASEGSFGPHPDNFFILADIEFMSFVDIDNDIVVVESEITSETNYSYKDITVHDEHQSFLNQVYFGTHGIIVKNMDNNAVLAKGVQQHDCLSKILQEAFKNAKIVRLQTDMRAMMNPTRMNTIQRLTIKLIQRLQAQCKKCGSPGFGKIHTCDHLICRLCGTKTEKYRSKILSCIKCDYEEKLSRDDGLQQADPRDCSYCNP